MRIFYLITLCSSLFLFLSARADPRYEVSGKFRLQVESYDHTDFIADRDFFSFRLRPRFTLIEEKYKIVFVPQVARIMGKQVYGVNTSGTTEDPLLGVHETYLAYRPSDWLVLTAGRMILSYGDEIVIGALEWNNVGRSFDGFKARYEHGNGWIDLFGAKLVENNSTIPTAPDQDFAGIYSTTKISPWLKEFDLYTLYSSPFLGAVGARAKSLMDGFDYRLEYTREFGKGILGPEAWQADGETGYQFNAAMKPRFGMGYFYAGADYFQYYPTAHKWLGQADVLGRRNVNGFQLNSQVQPSDQLKLILTYHRFYRSSARAPAFQLNGTSALGRTSGSASREIGSELDLNANYQLQKNMTLSCGGSLFFPGAYLKDQYGSISPKFFYAQIEVGF